MMEEILSNKWLKIGLLAVGGLALVSGLFFAGYKLGRRRVQLTPRPTPTLAQPSPTPTIGSTVKPTCGPCPLWTPPPPEFCLDGIIVSGGEDECKCPLPPRCLTEYLEQKEEYCVKVGTGESMSLVEAREVAQKSECVKEGSLKDEYFCNENTGTWWIGLDVEKEGCYPMCVVDVVTKQAEINWRCTGLIPR